MTEKKADPPVGIDPLELAAPIAEFAFMEESEAAAKVTEAPAVEVASEPEPKPKPVAPVINIALPDTFEAVSPRVEAQILVAGLQPVYGDVGQPYQYAYPLGIAECRVESTDFDRLGLTVVCADDELVIEGLPTVDFDGKARIRVRYHKEKILEVSCFFRVNPDPRSLWKCLEPSDEDKAKYDCPHTDCFGFELADTPARKRIVLAASRRGRAHEHDAKFREDFIWNDDDTESGWQFLAVADGAGSAKYSRKGSEIACKKSVELLKQAILKSPEPMTPEHLRDGAAGPNEVVTKMMHHVVYYTYMEIDAEAKAAAADVRDYSTTLLVAALKKFGDKWLMISYWVGDGALAIHENERSDESVIFELLGSPDGGEFAGQTRFLTMRNEIAAEPIRERVRVREFADFKWIILMSDGVSDPYFETENRILKHECWDKLWDDMNTAVQFGDAQASAEEKAKRLLEWLNFWSKGNHDDRSILIVY